MWTIQTPKVESFTAPPHLSTPTTVTTTSQRRSSLADEINVPWDDLLSSARTYAKYAAKSASLSFLGGKKTDDTKTVAQTTVNEILELCDSIDVTAVDDPRRDALEYGRYALLQSLMVIDYDAYVNTASFLSPLRIPRGQLPNVQDLPYVDPPSSPLSTTETVAFDNKDVEQKMGPFVARDGVVSGATAKTIVLDEDGVTPLTPDCDLEDKDFSDNPLDRLLLFIFRDLVKKNSDGLAVSDKPGILGLLEQGRVFMLQPDQTDERQHIMVKDTLRDLMTPVLPPVYRLFMSGIVPKRVAKVLLGRDESEEELKIGPLFYAPYLTSLVTPPLFRFLVGPSRPNARKDGRPGGLVVEKCRFLQESGCKGMCLHICKLPTEQFFWDELGMPLTVAPNFETQECQWSFGGDLPMGYREDPDFPKGCLVGCESRKQISERQRKPTTVP